MYNKICSAQESETDTLTAAFLVLSHLNMPSVAYPTGRLRRARNGEGQNRVLCHGSFIDDSGESPSIASFGGVAMSM